MIDGSSLAHPLFSAPFDLLSGRRDLFRCFSAHLLFISLRIPWVVASVPATYEALLSLLCTGPLCNHPTQASVRFVQQLQALGLSVQAYAIYYMMLNIIFVCAYFVVAIILFWRRSDDWMAVMAT